LLGGVLLLVLFVAVVERRAREPIVPLSLFRSRAFSAVNVLTFFLYAALSAATFLLPFNLIQVQGYTPARAGAAFLPFVGTMSLLSRWSGALADRIGPRLQLVAGPLLAGVGFVLMAIPSRGGSYWLTFFPGIAVLGLGMATAVAPLTTAVMTSIEERHAGAASGINNAVARAAGLLAIALFGAIAVALFARSLDARLQNAPPAVRRSMVQQSASLAAAVPPASLAPEMQAQIHQAIEASFIGSFRMVMFGAAALCAVAAGAGAFVPRRGRRP
jgi:MFS family permease